ncbi:MAG TPA: RHS repeat-associated core domain-containing protein [Pirellulales bacterium]|nr:RHS repeat-associated core domain-containing protein [Pirellulales bacterium]
MFKKRTPKSPPRRSNSLLERLSEGLPWLWMVMRPKPRRAKRRTTLARPGLSWRQLAHVRAIEQLEMRAMLSITANNANYDASSAGTLNVAAPGLLADCSDSGGYQMSAYLMGSPSYGTASVNTDGGFSYTPDPNFTGTDTFEYYATDTNGGRGNIAAVQLDVQMGVVTFVDTTKLPVDTIDVSRQILNDPYPDQAITSPLPAGGSGGTVVSAQPADGAPATAHNLSLEYSSIAGSPDVVLEGDTQLAIASGTMGTVEVSATLDGAAAGTSYFTTQYLGADPTVHVAIQTSTSLPTGCYPYTLTLSGSTYGTPTISGYVNVVNNSASPFGLGWDMPGLDRLYQNNVPGVPAGVLLTDGSAEGWYFTAGSGNSYTSPAGPHAFDTLTAVSGGGWQLVTRQGVTFTFNGSGDLTSRVERTGETTAYGWTGADLTSITDQFGRSVDLSYASGLLSSISDYAADVWSFGMTSGDLTSVTEPNPGGGSPVWQYAYSVGYMTSETDPNSNESQFVLNSYHRLSQTTLPGGASTADTSEQNYGYGGTQYQPSQGTLASSVVPSATDADGNTRSYQTDQLGDVISQTDAAGNTTTIQRDANGLPTVITQPPPTTGATSPVTTIAHDSMGNETSASGAMPTYGTWTFNAFGEWATFIDTTGKEWLRTFDSKGDVLTEQDPSGNQVSWTFNSYGEPLTMTVPAPNNGTGTETTQYFYDQYQRLDEIEWPDGSTQLFAYNADDRQTSFTNEDSATTTTAYDVLGRVVSVTNALNGVVSMTYDKDGNVLTTQDEMGNISSLQYNSRNELVQETLPAPATGDANPVLSFTYDANGNQLTSTSALGRVASYTWDKLNRMASETLPAPAKGQSWPVTTVAYDNLSRKVSETNALSGTTTWAYANADERLVTTETLPAQSGSGQGPTTTFGFDADGRPVTVTDAMNHNQTTAYTADAQVASVTDNLNHSTSYSYGHLGELLGTTDGLNHTGSHQYDSRFRLVQTTDANAGVTQITLDPAGNEVKLVDPAGNSTSWTYDQLNRQLTETNAGGTTTWGYNPSSDVTSIQDADGRVRDFTYDNLHRLTAEQWMSGGTVIATMAYTYDADNELLTASDPNSAYAFAYNGDGLVTSTDNAGTPNVPDVLLTNGYDLMGDRTSQSATVAGTLDFLNSYSYDGDQNLTSVTQQDQTGGNIVSPKEADYDYNALGQVTDTWAYNTLGGPRSDVLHGAYSYDTGNRLTGLAYTSNAGANTIDTLGWGYDAANNITSFTSIDGTASYGYDPTNQLTSATYTTAPGGTQPANESYSFDLNGNRTNTGYSTGSDNLITSDGTFNYQHDADGNTTVRTRISTNYASDYQTTYSWDYRNRLTDVEYYDNNSVLTEHVHYVYDVFDHLLATEVDTTGSGTYNEIEHYVLDVSREIPAAGVPGTALAQPVFVVDGNGNLTQRNLVALNPAGVDAVTAQEAVSSPNQGGVNTWAADDNLGTPHDIVSNSGTVLNHIVDTVFGETAYQSDPSVTWWSGFAGGHEDAITGLVNNYHRWYNPATATWESQDPAGFMAGDVNLSRYARNDPSDRIDPLGLQSPQPSPGGPFSQAAQQAAADMAAMQQQMQQHQQPGGVLPASSPFAAAVTSEGGTVAAAAAEQAMEAAELAAQIGGDVGPSGDLLQTQEASMKLEASSPSAPLKLEEIKFEQSALFAKAAMFATVNETNQIMIGVQNANGATALQAGLAMQLYEMSAPFNLTAKIGFILSEPLMNHSRENTKETLWIQGTIILP